MDFLRWASRSTVKFHGLFNQGEGGLCCLNSVLQVLFMTKEFRDAVERSNCPTTDFESHLKTLFTVYGQCMDMAAACLEQILSSLTNHEASQIFKGELTDKNTCSACGKVTNTDGPFWCLPLHVVESDQDKSYNVVDGIIKYFKESCITGENQMYCDGCEAKSDAVTNRVIAHHPDVLTVQLKRPDHRTQRHAQVKSSVDIPYNLHVPENQTYELYAFVEHFETYTAQCTATIKSLDNETWYTFRNDTVKLDDSKLNHEENILKSENACLLFYKKVTKTLSQDTNKMPTSKEGDITEQGQDNVSVCTRKKKEAAELDNNSTKTAPARKKLRPSESSPKQYHGLRHQGTTCCLNSVLQVLFMTKEFREAVERYKCATQCIDKHLKTLFGDLKKYTACAFHIIKHLGINKVYGQADAAACLEQILSSLTNPEASQMFKGKLTDKNICSACGKVTNTDGPFWCLPLQLVESDQDKSYNVVDGIIKYFKESCIAGENQMYCDGCEAKSDAVTNRVIAHYPDVLTVQLKRPDHRTQRHVKVKCSVDIPYNLHVPENQTYELYAFVEHFETYTAQCTATIKSLDNETWYTFRNDTVKLDDSKLNHEENILKSENACLLFYKKVTKTLTQDTNKMPTSKEDDITEQGQDNVSVCTRKKKEAAELDNNTTKTAPARKNLRPSQSSPKQYHGLINQGATCYLNSVLQVLFMTKEFREAVERYKCATQCIDKHLKTLFDDLKKYIAYTYNITRQLGINRVYEQADAAACLEQILSSLTNPEASQIFKGELTDKNICSACGKVTNTDDPFWCLPLQLVESDRDKCYNVDDGIRKYFEESCASGENQMYCDGCEAKSDAVTKRELKDHPVVLMLLLKRFTYRSKTYVKNHRAVHVPCTLQIPHDQTYELYAVVDHLGDLRSGHYTATIKSQDNERWYKFNDDMVTQLDDNMEDRLKSSTAYLLFYRKQKTHPAGTCTQDKREVSTHGDILPAMTDNYQQICDAEKIKIIKKKEEMTDACSTNLSLHDTDSYVPTHSLLNQKAMSSLSSVLQVLFMTKDFREAVERSICENPDVGLLDHQLKVVFDDLEGKSNKSSTSELIHMLDIHRDYEEDAAEYLVKILSLTSPDASQTFHGQLMDKTVCCNCFKEKIIEKTLEHVPLAMMDSLTKVFSVVDGIKEYFRDSRHILLNYQVYCDDCDVSYEIYFTESVIKHYPEVLVVHLRRFEFNNCFKRYTKNDRAVNVPRILKLPESQTYELYAFVDHVGDHKGGHYTAAIKFQDEKWYNYDDGDFKPLGYQPFQVDNAEELKNVYLLFYKKNETPNTKTQDMRDVSSNKGSPPVNTDNNQTLNAEKIRKKQEDREAIKVVSDTAEPAFSKRSDNTGGRTVSSTEKIEMHTVDDREGKAGEDKSRKRKLLANNFHREGLKDNGDRMKSMTNDDDHQTKKRQCVDGNEECVQSKGTYTMKPCAGEQNWPEHKYAYDEKQTNKQDNEKDQIKEISSPRQLGSVVTEEQGDANKTQKQSTKYLCKITEEVFLETPGGYILIEKNIETVPLDSIIQKGYRNYTTPIEGTSDEKTDDLHSLPKNLSSLELNEESRRE